MYFTLQGRQNEMPPIITLPYQPPDVCTGGDGDGDGNGASQLMYSTVAIFLPLMAVLF